MSTGSRGTVKGPSVARAHPSPNEPQIARSTGHICGWTLPQRVTQEHA